MKTFKDLITELITEENTEEFKDYKAGVLSSRLGGIPERERLKNKAFHGGFMMGISKGKEAALSKFRLWRKSRRKEIVKWGSDNKK